MEVSSAVPAVAWVLETSHITEKVDYPRGARELGDQAGGY